MDVLSVDFGTSSTVGVLAAFGRGPRAIEVDGSVTMSSAVYAEEDGQLVVGQDAERRARLDPSRFEPNPKRRIDDGELLLGDRTVPVADAFAAVLRRMGEEAERQLSGVPGEVRLSHPAGWGATRQQTLWEAALKAGFAQIRLVPEPVAAAAHYATLRAQAPRSGPIAIYDLGAGTFDCAVVGADMTVLAEDGLPDLGSLDIDQALLVHIGRSVSHTDPGQWQRLLRPQTTSDRRLRRVLLQDVRDAKESLSRHVHTEVPMPDPFGDVLVTRGELEALVRPNLLRSAEMLAATISRAGLTPEQLVGVYLVGGPSRMPLLASLVGSKLGVVPTTEDQPETAVAFGLHHVRAEEQASQSGPVAIPPSPPAPSVPIQAPPVPTPTRAPSAAAPVPSAPGWRQPQSGPQQQPPQPAMPVPPPGGWQRQPPKKRFSRTTMIASAAAAVVVVVGIVLAVVLLPGTSRDSPEAAGPASNAGKSVEPPVPGCPDTRPAQPGENGLTPCMRRLAGPTIQARASCSDDPELAHALGALRTAVCRFPDGTRVAFHEGLTLDQIEASARKDMAGTVASATWQAKTGLSGRYLAGIGPQLGLLVYQADTMAVVGTVMDSSASHTSRTPQDLVWYFERTVRPGE
ncbi:Hsp70 family protein [Amycolatopsis benzoatilytica]|uniref:Hsp70 family protein n=1 Tax=Amycolatopsis benzoatilytica TaxID=346045 RepID=UPI00035C5632|nr:Hsp70 family protein [Amycolatopsis benzoatilytica]